MCEAHAYLIENGVESRILESVDLVELENDTVKLTNIFGEQKSLKARLKSYSNSKGKLLFETV